MKETEDRQRYLTNIGEKLRIDVQEVFSNGRVENKIIKQKILDYYKASEEDWGDWKWQIAHQVRDCDLLRILFHTDSDFISSTRLVGEKYPFAIAPYYISLLQEPLSEDPLARMCLPNIKEIEDTRGELDPMHEGEMQPVTCVTRRYPDRLILNVTNQCGSYCRFCQRKRNISFTATIADEEQIQKGIEYIRNHSEIRDVLITGGDPLTLEDDQLEGIIKQVREIPHVEIIRLGTRMPVYIPERITEKLCKMLSKYHPIYINVHINHPSEISEKTRRALGRLSDSGIPLGNQMVLLSGVNNDCSTVLALNRELLRTRVRPYYIFHPKSVQGTMHFQCPLAKGLEIMEFLRGRLSGLGIPTYVINSKGGMGKVPILPNYVITRDEGKIALRTWENKCVKMDID